MKTIPSLLTCRRHSCSSSPSFWNENTIHYREYVDDEGNIVQVVPDLNCPVCGHPLEDYECLTQEVKEAILKEVEHRFISDLDPPDAGDVVDVSQGG